MDEPTYLTAEGKTLLVEELAILKGPKRLALAQRLRDAIEMGDLSENADYHKAKEDQAFLEGRIQELEYLIQNATIIEDNDDEKREEVEVGATVTIQETGLPQETYFLVGAKEADPRNGKISVKSPIGSALLGRHIGDEVVVNAPSGEIRFNILKIK